MSQKLMAQLIKHEKCCCIYSYFKTRNLYPVSLLAGHLGVSETTIRNWRKRIESGEVACGYEASGEGQCLHKP